MEADIDQKDRSVAWTADMSVGVDTIDEDHQGFFRLAELIYTIINRPDQNQTILIRTAINILEEYVQGHFLREEMAMAAVSYPMFDEHVAAHRAFSARVQQIAADFMNGNKDVAITLANLVTDWLTSHILTVDKQYTGILTNENVDNRPLGDLIEGDENEDDY